MSEKMKVLHGSLQCYHWGRRGALSAVARLAATAVPDFTLDEQQTYAELWLGTHPRGESVVAGSGEALSHWLAAHPATHTPGQQPGQLPFLLKVLSVDTALSIQVHPDKAEAERLHAACPERYPDPNHKPEMAIALTPFHALCGFRPAPAIQEHLTELPELRALVGEAHAQRYLADPSPAALQPLFTALVTADEQRVAQQLSALLARLDQMESRGDDVTALEAPLLRRLAGQYPGDVGCFVGYLLNHVTLQPGQALFLQANLPHAYLSGDCVEVMACSDNVVRAGLTPKPRDTATLCRLLDYRSLAAAETLFAPARLDPCLELFDPPVPDFTVARIQVPASEGQYVVRAESSTSILLVIAGTGALQEVREGGEQCGEQCGEAVELEPGRAVLVVAGAALRVTGSTGLLMFRAYSSGCSE